MYIGIIHIINDDDCLRNAEVNAVLTISNIRLAAGLWLMPIHKLPIHSIVSTSDYSFLPETNANSA